MYALLFAILLNQFLAIPLPTQINHECLVEPNDFPKLARKSSLKQVKPTLAVLDKKVKFKDPIEEVKLIPLHKKPLNLVDYLDGFYAPIRN